MKKRVFISTFILFMFILFCYFVSADIIPDKNNYLSGFDPDSAYVVSGQDSVNPSSGIFTLSYIDAALPGRNGLGITLTRTYNSGVWVNNKKGDWWNAQENDEDGQLQDFGHLGVGWDMGFGYIQFAKSYAQPQGDMFLINDNSYVKLPDGSQYIIYREYNPTTNSFKYFAPKLIGWEFLYDEVTGDFVGLKSPSGVKYTYGKIFTSSASIVGVSSFSVPNSHSVYSMNSGGLTYLYEVEYSSISTFEQANAATGTRYYLTRIEDTHGNFIEINYKNIQNSGGRINNNLFNSDVIENIVDSAGNEITFEYWIIDNKYEFGYNNLGYEEFDYYVLDKIKYRNHLNHEITVDYDVEIGCPADPTDGCPSGYTRRFWKANTYRFPNLILTLKNVKVYQGNLNNLLIPRVDYEYNDYGELTEVTTSRMNDGPTHLVEDVKTVYEYDKIKHEYDINQNSYGDVEYSSRIKRKTVYGGMGNSYETSYFYGSRINGVEQYEEGQNNPNTRRSFLHCSDYKSSTVLCENGVDGRLGLPVMNSYKLTKVVDPEGNYIVTDFFGSNFDFNSGMIAPTVNGWEERFTAMTGVPKSVRVYDRNNVLLSEENNMDSIHFIYLDETSTNYNFPSLPSNMGGSINLPAVFKNKIVMKETLNYDGDGQNPKHYCNRFGYDEYLQPKYFINYGETMLDGCDITYSSIISYSFQIDDVNPTNKKLETVYLYEVNEEYLEEGIIDRVKQNTIYYTGDVVSQEPCSNTPGSCIDLCPEFGNDCTYGMYMFSSVSPNSFDCDFGFGNQIEYTCCCGSEWFEFESLGGYTGGCETLCSSGTAYNLLSLTNNEYSTDLKGDIIQSQVIGLDGDPTLTTSFTYDQYGNILTTTDPENNIINARYDSNGMFPIKGWNQEFGSDSDPAWEKTYYPNGLLETVKDKNSGDLEIHYYYDELDRLTKVIAPYDNWNFPTIEIDYFDYFDKKIKVYKKILGAYPSNPIYYFYDGLGRLIQTRQRSADNIKTLVTSVKFNDLGQVQYESKVYEETESEQEYNLPDWENLQTNNKVVETIYDGLGRVKEIINFDGTSVSTQYGADWTIITDANGISTKNKVDEWGNLVMVEEDYEGGGSPT